MLMPVVKVTDLSKLTHWNIIYYLNHFQNETNNNPPMPYYLLCGEGADDKN